MDELGPQLGEILTGPCDHCGSAVQHEYQGSPFVLLCARCDSEDRQRFYAAKLAGAGELSGVDGYFGLCPVCHKTNGYINVRRDHWFYCKGHKTRWYFGSNLFSSWHYETEEAQRRIFDELDFGAFEEVEPFHPPRPAPPTTPMASNTDDDADVPF